MENENKTEISEELAMKDLERWAEDNDIDLYVTTKDGDKLLDATAPKLIKAIQRGSLVLNDQCEFEYTISQKSPQGFAGEKIVLRTPTSAAYMAMDSFKEQQSVHKTLALLSAMTGKDVSWFAKLSNIDYKILNFITSFFIAG